MTYAATQQRYRAKKAANGLCVYGGCKEAHLPGIISCLKHSGRKPRVLPKPCRGRDCLVLLWDYRLSYCPEHRLASDRESNQAAGRNHYHRMKEQGLCTVNGCHGKAKEGRAQCHACLKRAVVRQRVRKESMKGTAPQLANPRSNE